MNKYTLQFVSDQLEKKYQDYRYRFTIPAFKTISVICFFICVLRSILSAVLMDYINFYIFMPLSLVVLITYCAIMYYRKSLIDSYLVIINHILMLYQYTVNTTYDAQEAYLFGQMMMTLHLLVMLISDFKYAVLQLLNNLIIKSCIAELSNGVISVQTYLYTIILSLMAIGVLYKTNKQQRMAFLQTINDNSYEKIIPPLLENPFAIFFFNQDHLQFRIKISNFHEHPIFNPFQNNQQNLVALLRKYSVLGVTFEDFICSRQNVSNDKYFVNKTLDLTNTQRHTERLTVKYTEIFVTELLFMIVVDEKERVLQQQDHRIKLMEKVTKQLTYSVNQFLRRQLALVNKSEKEKPCFYQMKTKLMYILTKFRPHHETIVSECKLVPKLKHFLRLFTMAYDLNIQYKFSEDLEAIRTLVNVLDELLIQLMTLLSRIEKQRINLVVCYYHHCDTDYVDLLINVEEVSSLYVELQKNFHFRKTLGLIGPFDKILIENDYLLIRLYRNIEETLKMKSFIL